MLRKLAFLSMLAMLVAVAFGAAASLNVNGGAIQYGMDDDLTCDPDGVQVLGWGLETDDNTVYNVRIGEIDPNCVGNSLFVRVEDSSGGVLGYWTILDIQLPEYNLDFSPRPSPEDITKLLVWLEGSAP